MASRDKQMVETIESIENLKNQQAMFGTIGELWRYWGYVLDISFEIPPNETLRSWIQTQSKNTLKLGYFQIPRTKNIHYTAIQFYVRSNMVEIIEMFQENLYQSDDIYIRYNKKLMKALDELKTLYEKDLQNTTHTHQPQMNEALDRLISICEKLADQKKLAR